jgi:hypothetical protein
MMDVQRSVPIGHAGCFPEFKTVWEAGPPRRPCFLRRDSEMAISAEFRGDPAFLDEAWADIAGSAIAAGAVAGLSAILASPALALPAFEDAFLACMASCRPEGTHRLQVSLSVRLRPLGGWHRV